MNLELSKTRLMYQATKCLLIGQSHVWVGQTIPDKLRSVM